MRCARSSRGTRAGAGRSRLPRRRRGSASTSRSSCESSSARRSSSAASFVPAAREREWCDPDVLRRLRRASLAALRREVEPVEQAALGRFLPSWHGIDRRASLREALIPLQALALPVALWEAEVLPRRVPGYRPEQLDQLCASGELVWVGAGLDRVAVFFRDDAPLLGRPAAAPAPEGEAHDAIRAALAGGALFWDGLLGATGLDAETALPALWDLVWSGEVTNDSWAPLRAERRYQPPRPDRRARRFSRARAHRPTATQGRWSLAAELFAGGEPDRRALAELLLERHGIVTRDAVRAEGIPGGYSAVYGELRALETLGSCRRGYFVEGLGGAQFALGGAVERLRELRPSEGDEPEPLVLAAADPAQPYGAVIPWPKRSGARAARVAGAHVVLLGGEPALFVERGGRSLVPLREPDEEWLRPALAALVGVRQARRCEAACRRALRRRAGDGDARHAAARRSRLPRRPAARRAPRLTPAFCSVSSQMIASGRPEGLMSSTPDQASRDPRQALWEKGDFTRITDAMRRQRRGARPPASASRRDATSSISAAATAPPPSRRRSAAPTCSASTSRRTSWPPDARAQARGLANIRFENGDASDLKDLPDDTFDTVVTMFGAMFAPGRETVATEMVRVRRPGGRIVMGNWIPGDPTLVAQILQDQLGVLPAAAGGLRQPDDVGHGGERPQAVRGGRHPRPGASPCETTLFLLRRRRTPFEFLTGFRDHWPTMNACAAAAADGGEASARRAEALRRRARRGVSGAGTR